MMFGKNFVKAYLYILVVFNIVCITLNRNTLRYLIAMFLIVALIICPVGSLIIATLYKCSWVQKKVDMLSLILIGVFLFYTIVTIIYQDYYSSIVFFTILCAYTIIRYKRTKRIFAPDE